MVWNSTTHAFEVNANAISATAWLINGNSNITLSNFLGTTNANDVIFKTANVERMRIIGSVGSIPQGDVGIGQIPKNKLDVYSDAAAFNNAMAGSFVINGTYAFSTYTTFTGVSGISDVQNATSSLNIGGDFSAHNAASDYGVRGMVSGTTNSTSTRVAGGTGNRYWAGYFNGFVFSTQVYQGSDEALKINIEDLTDGLETINQLSPKSYLFKTDNDLGLHLSNEKQRGFIAQDVKNVLPDLVVEVPPSTTFDSLGNVVNTVDSFQALNYIGIIPIAVKAIQELSAEIDELKAKLDSCCTASGKNLRSANPNGNDNQNQQTIELKNVNAIILDQNAPNPFAETTVITYNISEDVLKSQIIFFDSKGRVLKEVEITGRGAGSLQVYASDLSDGNYSYSLLADGRLIDTRKMVKQR